MATSNTNLIQIQKCHPSCPLPTSHSPRLHMKIQKYYIEIQIPTQMQIQKHVKKYKYKRYPQTCPNSSPPSKNAPNKQTNKQTKGTIIICLRLPAVKKTDGANPMIFFNLVKSQSGLIQPPQVTVIEQA